MSQYDEEVAEDDRKARVTEYETAADVRLTRRKSV